MHASIVRVHARAELDASDDEALQEACEQAANGDTDRAWLLREREAGRVLLARLAVSVIATDVDARREEVAVVNNGVWLERDSVPHVEAQVSQTATKDFARLVRKLRERALYVESGALDGMYVHVALGVALLAALEAGAADVRHAL